MKRNHTTRREPKSGMSSYRRHGKKPFTYSQALRQWERWREENEARNRNTSRENNHGND